MMMMMIIIIIIIIIKVANAREYNSLTARFGSEIIP
jgi:hypothetical protein